MSIFFMSFHLNPWFLATNLGDPRLWIFLCVILFFFRIYYRKKVDDSKKKFKWVSAFIVFAGFAMASSLGVNEVLKLVFQIPRACSIETNPYCLGTFSFPSGHTAVAFTVFAGVYYILNKRKYLCIFVLPVIVGISRIVLGVHTIQDVVAGAGVGLAVFFIYLLAASRIRIIRRFISVS